MNGDEQTSLEEVVNEMVGAKFPDGLVRVLESKFPKAPHADVEDAVATGFEKLIRAKRVLDNPRGYVTTVSVNALKRSLRFSAVQRLAVGEDDDVADYLDRDADSWADPTHDETLANDAYVFMRGMVETWESRNVRTTTLFVLEAGRLEEPLTSAELAERLEEVLGQDVLPELARQWRKRGLDKLRAQLADTGLLEEA